MILWAARGLLDCHETKEHPLGVQHLQGYVVICPAELTQESISLRRVSTMNAPNCVFLVLSQGGERGLAEAAGQRDCPPAGRVSLKAASKLLNSMFYKKNITPKVVASMPNSRPLQSMSVENILFSPFSLHIQPG
jgi:hypothetical protein